MILVLCGTQIQHFNRMIDEAIKLYDVDQNIVIQKGNTPFEHDRIQSFDFVPFEELMAIYDEADLIITHAGAGSLIEGIKKGKRIITFPRFMKYDEHVNDHQMELAEKFDRDGHLIMYHEGDDIHTLYQKVMTLEPKPWAYQGNIPTLIDTYIKNHQQTVYEKIMMSLVSHKFLRFALIGVLNTIVDLTIFKLLISTGSYYMLAKVISFLSAVLFSYFMNTFFTYRVQFSLKKMLLFPLSTLPNLLMQLISLYVFVEFFDLGKMISAFISLIVAVPISFLIAKKILEK